MVISVCNRKTRGASRGPGGILFLMLGASYTGVSLYDNLSNEFVNLRLVHFSVHMFYFNKTLSSQNENKRKKTKK